jgi:imidazole glycerol-phosphate synthase
MQVLFQSSAESASAVGLGIIPTSIGRFDDAHKAVPHMGWNAAHLLDEVHQPAEGVSSLKHYYFVHSYRARYDPVSNPTAAAWAHSVTQYGDEVFIASVRRANVFGTQFHPEKSGEAGLALLRAWLSEPESARANAGAAASLDTNLRAPWTATSSGLTKRIIACMDVRANDEGDLVVTKGDQYDVREKSSSLSSTTTTTTGGAVRNLGKPIALAEKYSQAGADELCLLNITSFRNSPLHDQPMLALVRAAAARVFVPLTIGGGIKDTRDPDGTAHSALEVAGAYFRAGADKVSIGSEAVYAVEKLRENGGKADGTSAIETIARTYGRQAVVVSIDPRRVYVDADYAGPRANEVVRGEDGKAWWYRCTVSGGREDRDVSVVELARGVEALGAGELLVNSIDRDGGGKGFDVALMKLVKAAVKVPVVASSGAGSAQHFVQVFQEAGVEAALAAGIFHREEVRIQDVKGILKSSGIAAR